MYALVNDSETGIVTVVCEIDYAIDIDEESAAALSCPRATVFAELVDCDYPRAYILVTDADGRNLACLPQRVNASDWSTPLSRGEVSED